MNASGKNQMPRRQIENPREFTKKTLFSSHIVQQYTQILALINRFSVSFLIF